MTDQKLVDELEKALNDEVYDGGMGALSEDQLSELVRTLASTAAKVAEEARTPADNEKLIEEAKHLIEQAGSFREQVGDDASPTSMIGLWLRTADALHDALAVFEKALTSTDDEREALRIAELDARQAAYRKEDWFVDHEAEPEIATNAFFRGWDAAVGGGFRRSEVSEPSADWYDLAVKAFPWDASEGDAVLDARRRMVQVLTDNFPEPSAECAQPCVHLSQHDAREGRTCAEHPCTCPEPQGEPSSAQEAIRVASPDTWGWDACMVCGSKDVTDRGMMVLFSAKDGVYVSRVAWCDQSQECRDDLRQAGASMLTDQDAKSIDAALRAAAGVVGQEGEK